MPKIVWVALPLAAYALYRGWSAWREGAPSRHALNVQTSVLLMLYLLVTAGLGIFWVANQQLPVFDLHYLFGYATLLLVAVHLSFNLPIVSRYLKKLGGKKRDKKRVAPSKVWRAGAVLLAIGASFFLGMRHGKSELSVQWGEGSPDAAKAGAIDAIVKYHEYSSSSRAGVFARSAGVDWGPRPPPFKRYDGASIALENPRDAELAERPLAEALRVVAADRPPLDRAMLGAILFAGAGVTKRRSGLALRASPSSGALFSSELYVLSWDVGDLAPGVYHYDPERHRLDVISEEPPPRDAATRSAPAAIVVTSIFRRTGFKYKDRAYRYAVADTGHLIENMRIGASEAGLHARPLRQFDEQITGGTIGVDGLEEGVLAVLSLESPGRPAEDVAPLFRFPEPPTDPAIGVTGLVHVATSLVAEPLGGDAIRLPAPRPTRGVALDLIRKRRSVRRYTSESVTLEQLATLLGDVAMPPQLSRAVRVHVVANRVKGLDDGVYRYHPYAHVLTSTRRGSFAEEAGSAALAQDVIRDAAVVLVLSAHRSTMFGAGARGYRHAFIEAGMFSERYLLSAIAQGLGACPVGAFYDDDAASLIGVDAGEEWVIHFIGAGPT